MIKPSWETQNTAAPSNRGTKPSWETGADTYKPAPTAQAPTSDVSPWLQDHPTLNKYVFEPIRNLTQAYEQTGAGKFNVRTSQTALGTISGAQQEPVSTGNKVADTAADLLGFTGGAMMLGGTGMMPFARNTAQKAAISGGENALLSTTQGVARGDSPGQIAKDTAMNAAFGAAFGVAPDAIGGVAKGVKNAATDAADMAMAKKLGMPIEMYQANKGKIVNSELPTRTQTPSWEPAKNPITKETIKTPVEIKNAPEQLTPQSYENILRKEKGIPEKSSDIITMGPSTTEQIRQGTKPDVAGVAAKDVIQLKDISGFKAYTSDVYRNFKQVFGDKFDQVKQTMLDPFDASKKANIDTQQIWTTKLKEEVVDKLGITKGSKLSALVQRYGEGTISPEELISLTPDEIGRIKAADAWFRKAYDQLLDEVNDTRAQIYPNNPDKLVPKRKDYYRHFRDLSDTFEGVKNLFETPSAIDPSLAGRSDFTLPRSKFAGFMQRRGLGPYKNDAVGGFLEYIPSASYAKHIDPHIGNFERLANELEGVTKDSKNLNKFIEYLRDYSRDLAGKTNVFDRAIQKVVPGGRTTFRVLNWLNSRVKANVILGNVASSMSQLANIPQGIAFAKQYSAVGAGKTMKSVFKPSTEMTQSGFLRERFSGKMYRQFDTKWFQQPKNAAIWMMETADRIGTEFVWNSTYTKAVAEGIQNPVKYADDMTRNLVAGRGIGEVPIAQKSTIAQLVMPFTLEVANLWRVQKDFISAKDFGGLAILYLANMMFNKGMEATRGSGVLFDPIDAMMEAFAEEDINPAQRVGRVAGEVISNIPLGQSIASMYPEYGTDTLPTRKEIFGRNDPTRFGSGLLLTKGLSDPLAKIAPPFGGYQVEKTIKGAKALIQEGVYNKDGTKMYYPVERNIPNVTKGLLFGPSAMGETKEYYDNNRRALSESQTKQVQNSQNPKANYEAIMKRRAIDTINNKISDIQKDNKLTAQEKQREINKLVEKRNQLTRGG